jgi:uncharacterized protein (DUF302 family)
MAMCVMYVRNVRMLMMQPLVTVPMGVRFARLVLGDIVQGKTCERGPPIGIITEIDVQMILSEKIGVAFRKYRILGACNPKLAHEALLLEDKVGTMLLCNVVVQELDGGLVEVAAIDPVASMQAVDNPRLKVAAAEVGEKLKRVITRLGE